MKNNIRIVIVSKQFPPDIRGGGEISAYHLAQGLSSVGVDVHVVTSSGVQKVEGSIFTLHPVIKKSKLPGPLQYLANNEFFYWNTYKAVSKILKLYPDVNIVHAMNMDSIPGAVCAAKKNNVKSVITINSQWLSCPYGYMLKMFDNYTVCDGKCNLLSSFRCYMHSSSNVEKLFGPMYSAIQMFERKKFAVKTDAVVCISNNIKTYVADIFKNKMVEIIPNICEFNTNHNSTLELSSNILFIGNLGKFKGCEYVIKAMPKIVEKFPDCIFRIVGDGDRSIEFRMLAERLGVEKNIIFEGFIPPDKTEIYYANSEIVVFPSIVPETFGRVAAEAMAFGKPVVASNAGAIPEIVKNMETGIIVKSKSVDEIADAVIYLLGNPEIAKQMGATGQRIANEKYSSKVITNTYLNIYQRILA